MSIKTASEIEFERFLMVNGLSFERVEEAESRRPDYRIEVGGCSVFFEVKELSEDGSFTTEPMVVFNRIVGDHIRRKISDSRKQVQFGASKGCPSVLLIYNNLDPIHMWGTENHDFIAAMYGEYTLMLDRATGETLDSYHGRKHSVAPERNTSFSAVGRLMPVRGNLHVTLFENSFAKIKLPTLPACFDVKHFDITYSDV